jgi:hypothetical protein
MVRMGKSGEGRERERRKELVVDMWIPYWLNIVD